MIVYVLLADLDEDLLAYIYLSDGAYELLDGETWDGYCAIECISPNTRQKLRDDFLGKIHGFR